MNLWHVDVVTREFRLERTFSTLEAAKLDYLIWCASPCVRAASLVNPDGALVWIHAPN